MIIFECQKIGRRSC